MNSNLQLLYKSTLSKYQKFKSRFDKNVNSGHFYELSNKAQHQIISRLERLKRRITELKTQIKLALVSGALVFCLSTTTQAQQLGPFIQNDPKNPFFRTAIVETDVKTTFGDLDFDGDFDMILGNGAGYLRFFRNDGDANNARFVELTGTDNPFNLVIPKYTFASPKLLDLDGDGDLDLMLGDRGDYSTRNVRYFQNNDDADAILGNELSFTEITGASNPIDEINGQYNNADPALGDLDGDGDLDILMGNSRGYAYGSYTGEALTFFRNNGGSLFVKEDAYANLPGLPTFSYGDNNITPTLFDLDGDGDLDLFVGNGSFGYSGQIRFFRNNDIDLVNDPSDTQIGDNISFTEQGSGYNPFFGVDKGYNASVSFIDLDGDGDKDAVIGSSTGIYYFENNANTFTERSGLENPFDAIEFGLDAAPTTVDLDGDGYLDVVIGEKYGETLYYFENNHDGTFDEKTGASNPFDNILINNQNRPVPAFADIDNDSDLDLFISIDDNTGGPSSAKVIFFRNDGSNNFIAEASPITTYQNYSVFSASLGDFDNDSDYDVIIGGYDVNYSGSNFLFLENTGTAFTEIPSSGPPINDIDVGDNYLKPVFIDLDHDGDLDVVSGAHQDSYSGQLIFFRNLNGNLIQQAPVANPFDGLSVGYDSHPAFLDIDNDGDLDALVGNYNGQITLFENQNEPPQIIAGATPLTFTEGDAPISVHPTLDITDDGNDLILGATVKIQNYVNGEDVLTFDPISNPDWNITASFETAGLNAGTLVITGLDTIKNYRTVLQSVKYQNTSVSPNTTTRNIQFAVTDFDNTNPTPAVIPINVISVNTAPSLSASGGNANYTEGTTPGVIIDPAITVSDIDNTNLQSATISITTNFTVGQDTLQYSTINGITGDYNAPSGILTLTGPATVADFRAALRTVRYSNNSANPNLNNRTIRFRVNDGEISSSSVSKIVSITPVNDQPVLTSSNLGIPVTYTQNALALIVDDQITISDVDNTSLSGMTISILGYQSGDILSVPAPTGISASFDNVLGILTLSGSSSVGNYISAASTVEFTSSGSGTRQIEFIANDGELDSDAYLRDLNIVLPNEAPIITSANQGTVVNYMQNSSPTLVDNQLTVSDSDDTTIESVIVSINGYQSGDVLNATPSSGITSNFDTSTGILSLTGSAPIADYIAAVVTTSFSSSGTGTRQIEFVANDGTDNSNLYSRQVDIVVNVAPVLSSINVGTTVNYNQNGTALLIDNQISVSDSDDANLESLTVSINGFISGDVLAATSPNETNSNFDTSTGILSIMGTASLTDYQTAMRTVTFSSSNGVGNRTIEFIVNDGNDNSNLYTRDLSIAKATLPPVVNTTPSTTQIGGLVTINWCDIIEDPDNEDSELTIEVVSILSGATTNIVDCDLTIDYSNVSFEGEDSIVLRATDPDGNSDENTLTVTVELLPIKVYNAISPNGDGANDWWQIENLLTPNKIELYNRWGDLVKTLTDFTHEEDNTALNDLPAGTYFYKITSDKNGEHTGYISIKK